jgi:hypothetical protein
MIGPVFRLLLLLCALSLGGIAAVLWLVHPQWHAPEPQLPDMASLAPRVVALPHMSAPLIQLGLRPLFLEERRPYVAPTAEAPPPPDPDPFPEVELVGLFGSGPDAGVILRSKGEVSRVRVGGQWSGWKLERVDPVAVRALFVTAGRADHELRLKRLPQQGGLVADLAPLPATMPADVPNGGQTDTSATDAEPQETGAASAADLSILQSLQERQAARDAARQSRQRRINQ